MTERHNVTDDWKGSLLAGTLVVLLLLPFLSKPVNIDETTYIWIAKQILNNPLKPYAFDANWFGFQQPMASISQSPPLVSYYLAVIGALFGWHETVLHLAFLLPAFFLVTGIYRLTVLLGPAPGLAIWLAILSPAMLVSATSLMLDVTMLAFYVWAIFFWIKSYDYAPGYNRGMFCLLACLAILTKYFAVTLIPLGAAFSVMKNKRIRFAELLWLCVPLIFLLCFEAVNAALHDWGHFTGAFSFLLARGSATFEIFGKIVTGMIFLGGSTVHLLLMAPLMWSGKSSFAWIGSVPLAGICFLALGGLEETALFDLYAKDTGTAMFTALLFVSGVHVVLLSFFNTLYEKSPVSILLLLWVAGTIVFSLFVNWAITTRTLLPALPPIAILAAQRIGRRERPGNQLQRYWKWSAIFLSMFLAVVVTHSDFNDADSQKRAAGKIMDRFDSEDNSVWFQGHWGFQHYMETQGARAFDFRKPEVVAGDIVVVPLNNTNVHHLPTPPYTVVARLKIDKGRWLTLMDYTLRVGFHTGQIGGLPYYFGRIQKDEYVIYRLLQEPGFRPGGEK